MNKITFSISNNAWINNGLVRLIIEIENRYNNEISINNDDNYIILSSNTDKDIEYYLNKIIHYLASEGTYNYSQIFKSINKYLKPSFSPQSKYPEKKNEFKIKKEVPKEIRKELKNYDKRPVKSKEQIWKMRLSYINNPNNYIKYGLNFESSDLYTKLSNKTDKSNHVCPNCGILTDKLLDIPQSINPLINEHHNNENDGFSRNFRKKNKICPNCFYLSLISVFDKYIPFYRYDSTFLALPNIYDLNILKKIAKNLSESSQFIDLAEPDVINYNTNIKFMNSSSNSAALLCLLHNIQNNFSKDETNSIFEILNDNELMEITDWIFINKDSFSINRIKANRNVYKILKKQFDDEERKIYLVNDFFNKIIFHGIIPFQIDKFFKSFLELDDESIASSLFELFKSNVSFLGSSPIFLFKKIFLNQIMGEIIMLDEEYKKACKSIAENIGKSFYLDIGLLSKFAYATDEQNFKEYIEEAFFLMAKKSALGNENYYSNNKELEILFDNLNNDTFKETKSYFVSFMSSSALYEKYKNNSKKNTE